MVFCPAQQGTHWAAADHYASPQPALLCFLIARTVATSHSASHPVVPPASWPCHPAVTSPHGCHLVVTSPHGPTISLFRHFVRRHLMAAISLLRHFVALPALLAAQSGPLAAQAAFALCSSANSSGGASANGKEPPGNPGRLLIVALHAAPCCIMFLPSFGRRLQVALLADIQPGQRSLALF